MKKLCIVLACTVLLWGCENRTSEPEVVVEAAATLKSGVETTGMDTSIRPQDDYYAYANGGWLATTEIPADQVGWGSYMTLRDKSLKQLRIIIDEVSAEGGGDQATAKIGAYYRAYLNEEQIEQAALSPLEDLFTEIDALDSHDAVAALFGSGNVIGLDAPFNMYINQDDKNPEKYVIFIVQSGLGLPDRDYYFDESERGVELRTKYVAFVEQMLDLSAYADAASGAERIMALETQLAQHQWDKVDSRDADKVYNKTSDEELAKLLSNFNLDGYFAGIGTARLE